MTPPSANGKTLELKISVDQITGGISVNGPIDQPLIAYGMLECAKDAIRAHNMNKAQGRSIVVPTLEFSARRQ